MISVFNITLLTASSKTMFGLLPVIFQNKAWRFHFRFIESRTNSIKIKPTVAFSLLLLIDQSHLLFTNAALSVNHTKLFRLRVTLKF